MRSISGVLPRVPGRESRGRPARARAAHAAQRLAAAPILAPQPMQTAKRGMVSKKEAGPVNDEARRGAGLRVEGASGRSSG